MFVGWASMGRWCAAVFSSPPVDFVMVRVGSMKKPLTMILALTLIGALIPFSQSSAESSVPGLSCPVEEVAVNPYVQAGFQHVGSNMNLPVGSEGPVAGLLQIGQIDLSLKDANLWTGTVGVTVKKGELFSLFASIGGSLNHPFVVSGQVPISLGPVGPEPTVDFTTSNLNMWYAQGGVSLGPILLGVYGSHFGVEVADPRVGSVPLSNQTLRGDIISTTMAPYIGFAVPASTALLTVIYSPLAMSKTTLALRTSDSNLAQAQYKWNKPGNFLSCNFQYNMPPIRGSSLGVWLNYAYQDIRGNAQLDFQDSTAGVTRQRDVTATMTQYVIQGGLTWGITF